MAVATLPMLIYAYAGVRITLRLPLIKDNCYNAGYQIDSGDVVERGRMTAVPFDVTCYKIMQFPTVTD